MALSDLEKKKTDQAMLNYVERIRPPVEMRDKLDISYRISDQSVVIHTLRPGWQDPSQIRESPVAKATFVRSAGVWKIYWMRADLKWHSYQEKPQVSSIAGFIKIVEADDCGCFWG